jgi:hypothetical protein
VDSGVLLAKHFKYYISKWSIEITLTKILYLLVIDKIQVLFVVPSEISKAAESLRAKSEYSNWSTIISEPFPAPWL